MKRSILFKLIALGFFFATVPSALLAQENMGSRIKDVAQVVGRRDNMVSGYGLVVGLNGQGDSDPVLTRQTVANIVKNYGITVNQTDIKAKNCATVMVTGRIRADTKNGDPFDISVASTADASSLQGGQLLMTPLMGGDGRVYAVAQGSLSIGGFSAGSQAGTPGGATLTKNHPTAGQIPNGAILEREIPMNPFRNGVLELSLREGDYTSAVRMANAINQQLGPIAHAISSKSVRVFVPDEVQAQPDDKGMEFIARVENVIFRPDTAARIVINERTGTIIYNSHVKIDAVAVSQGNLTVSIVNTQNVSQPNSFTGNGQTAVGGAGGSGGAAAQGLANAAQVPLTVGNNVVYQNASGSQVQVPIGQQPPEGYTVVMTNAAQAGTASPGAAGGNATVPQGPQTAITNQTTLGVEEEKKNLVVFNDLPTAQDVAAALNALGVTPRDVMSIFQTMKRAGALQAELVLQPD